MKTIVVATDFSPAAENAQHYAARLALQSGTALLLAHVYQVPVSMSDIPVLMLSTDELKESTEDMLQRSRQELQGQYPGLTIATESRLGVVSDELEDMCNARETLAVVMGSHGTSGLERLLFGSVTSSLIRRFPYPVIAVPAGYKEFRMQKIVLAADLLDPSKVPAQTILEIVQQLHAQLNVVHVVQAKEEDRANLTVLLEKLQPLQPAYQTVRHDNVKEGLLHYLEQNGVDLLMVLPHEHSLMERLFFKLHSDGIIRESTIPVLAIRC